jgi:uncharacterized protein YbjQ (UPF0145 family)
VGTATLIQFLVPLVLLVGAYFIGTSVETKHYRSLRTREHASRRFLTVTFPYEPDNQRVLDATLVTGSVVVSVDYFKRFIAGLHMIFGGRVTSYESLLDRARREAILRMKAEANARGFNAVVNVRLETSRIASSHGNNQGTAAVEILAFGTAVKFEILTSLA